MRGKVERVHDPYFGVRVEHFVEVGFSVDEFHLEVFLVILQGKHIQPHFISSALQYI